MATKLAFRISVAQAKIPVPGSEYDFGPDVVEWNGDPSRQSLVTLEFHAQGAKTELVLRQEGLGTVSNRDDHGKGWNGTLNKLERYLIKV